MAVFRTHLGRFFPPVNLVLEEAWVAYKSDGNPDSRSGLLTIISREWDYNHTLNFHTMLQTHIVTGKERQVRRCLVTAE